MMLELFRDPAWQFVGAVLAFAALAATFLVYWLQRQRKALAFEVISKNQLLTVREELEGRLQVLYEGHPTRDICILVVKLFNSGNVPISSSDYERPLLLSTGPTSKVLSGAVTAVDPENLAAMIEIAENRVTLQPILLNPKDSITLKLLVSDFCGSVAIDGRVFGVRSISKTEQTSGYQTLILIFGLVLFSIGASLVFTFGPKPEIVLPSPIEVKIGYAVAGTGYLAMLVTIGKSRSLRMAIRRMLRFRLG